jgi:hypothetical protein
MKTVPTFLLALSPVALAQSITYELPTVYQVTGHGYGASPEQHAVTGFDASTYAGLAFATTQLRCRRRRRSSPINAPKVLQWRSL